MEFEAKSVSSTLFLFKEQKENSMCLQTLVDRDKIAQLLDESSLKGVFECFNRGKENKN